MSKRFIHIELFQDEEGGPERQQVQSEGLKGYEQIGLLFQVMNRITQKDLARKEEECKKDTKDES